MPYSQIGKIIGKSSKCVSEKIRRLNLPSKLQNILSKKKSHSYLSYSSWSAMMTRCYNSKRENWKDYGGRGIKVCDRWHNFMEFLSDMGEKPSGYTIDRIDPNKNYEPDNCRWIPNTEQSKTTRLYLNVKLCFVCNKQRGNRKGRCHACNEYFRRNKTERPSHLFSPCHTWVEEHKSKARELSLLRNIHDC